MSYLTFAPVPIFVQLTHPTLTNQDVELLEAFDSHWSATSVAHPDKPERHKFEIVTGTPSRDGSQEVYDTVASSEWALGTAERDRAATILSHTLKDQALNNREAVIGEVVRQGQSRNRTRRYLRKHLLTVLRSAPEFEDVRSNAASQYRDHRGNTKSEHAQLHLLFGDMNLTRGAASRIEDLVEMIEDFQPAYRLGSRSRVPVSGAQLEQKNRVKDEIMLSKPENLEMDADRWKLVNIAALYISLIGRSEVTAPQLAAVTRFLFGSG